MPHKSIKKLNIGRQIAIFLVKHNYIILIEYYIFLSGGWLLRIKNKILHLIKCAFEVAEHIYAHKLREFIKVMKKQKQCLAFFFTNLKRHRHSLPVHKILKTDTVKSKWTYYFVLIRAFC